VRLELSAETAWIIMSALARLQASEQSNLALGPQLKDHLRDRARREGIARAAPSIVAVRHQPNLEGHEENDE